MASGKARKKSKIKEVQWQPDPGVGKRIPCDCARCRQLHEDWPTYYVGNASHSRGRGKWLIRRMLKLWRRRQKENKTRLGRRRKRKRRLITRARTDRAFLWIRFIVNAARWRLAYECHLELEARPDMAERGRAPRTEGEAIEEGLTVRARGLHGYFAPLLSGRCDWCRGLRPKVRRFCLRCETMLRRELAKTEWTPAQVEHYLAAPVAGIDQFADGDDAPEKTLQDVVTEALTGEIATTPA